MLKVLALVVLVQVLAPTQELPRHLIRHVDPDTRASSRLQFQYQDHGGGPDDRLHVGARRCGKGFYFSVLPFSQALIPSTIHSGGVWSFR